MTGKQQGSDNQSAYETFGIETVSGVAVLTLKSVFPPLREELGSFIASQSPDKVVINLCNITQLLSAGLYGDDSTMAVLIKLRTEVALVLCGMTDELLEVFRTTRLDRVFDIRDTVADALR